MSKNIIRADDKHADTFDLGGALWKIEIPGSETGNQFSLVESISPPGIGSPLHRHIRADQAIYVLEGELEILADSKSFSFTKGETCLIRRGAPHREINSSRSETRFITIHSPGFFSEFIRLAGIPVPVGTKVPPPSTPNIDEARKLVEIGLEFDVEILTPLEKLAGTGKQ
jgi:quercetin dioxygenase-like cupin family protein